MSSRNANYSSENSQEGTEMTTTYNRNDDAMMSLQNVSGDFTPRKDGGGAKDSGNNPAVSSNSMNSGSMNRKTELPGALGSETNSPSAASSTRNQQQLSAANNGFLLASPKNHSFCGSSTTSPATTPKGGAKQSSTTNPFLAPGGVVTLSAGGNPNQSTSSGAQDTRRVSSNSLMTQGSDSAGSRTPSFRLQAGEGASRKSSTSPGGSNLHATAPAANASFRSRVSRRRSSDSDDIVDYDDDDNQLHTFGGLRKNPLGVGGEDGKEEEAERPTCCSKLTRRPKRAACLEHSSFFILSGDNRLRLFLFNVQRNKIFEGFIIFNIIANCVFLALDDPTTDEVPAYQQYAEYYFTAVFTLEMILKAVGMGFILHKGSYLRNSWNIIDFFIVVLSYMALSPDIGNYSSLRTVRVLRPLRSMNQIRGLKIIVVGLLHSLTGLVHVLILLLFAFAIFGILGVQLWKGLYRMRCATLVEGVYEFSDQHCVTGSSSGGWNGYECPTGSVCKAGENPWDNYLHFDNLPSAALVLFTLITFEDWTAQLQVVFDVYGQVAIIYFVLFLVIGSYFISNLALAVINDKFVEAHARSIEEEEEEKHQAAMEARLSLAAATNLKEENEQKQQNQQAATLPTIAGFEMSANGEANIELEIPRVESEYPEDEELTPFQKKVESIRNTIHIHAEGYPRPSRYATSEELDIAQEEAPTTLFVKFIVLCIIINTILLGSQHFNQPDWLTETQRIGNYCMIAIFGVEFLVKHVAMGFKNYWRQPFNFLDGTIVILSFIELGIAASSTVSVFRALRLLRVIKLLKSFKSLRKIIRVMLSAVKSTGYLNLIMLLYIFIAALLGMQLFGGVMRKGETPDEPIRTTFDSFYWSIIAIFQILTRDNWIDLMIIAGVNTTPAAVLFFIGCVLIGDFLILNLFLAILIGAFEEDASSSEDGAELDVAVSRNGSDMSRSASFKMKKSIFMGSVKPEEVIHIGAPMAKQIKRAQMIRRATSIFGLKEAVVLSDRPTSASTNAKTNRRISNSSSTSNSNVNLMPHRSSTARLDAPPNQFGAAAGAAVATDDLKKLGTTDNRLDTAPYTEPPTTIEDSIFGDKEQSLALAGSTQLTSSLMEQSEDGDDDGSRRGSIQHQDVGGVVGFHAFEEENEYHDPDKPYVAPPFCPKCCTDMQKVLDEPPLIIPFTVEEVHDRMCKSIAVRKSKEKILEDLVSYVQRQNTNRQIMTPEKLETLIGQAWACGLMLSFTVDEFMASGKWSDVLQALITEQQVLDLRVGEEQVGRSLLVYTASNVPVDHQTNGGNSCFVFGPLNPFRLLCSELIAHHLFDKIILSCIVVSSILLAADNPRDDQTTTFYDVLYGLDVMFTAIFCLEMVLKVISLGFVFYESAYLRDGWNILDFFIVIVSIVSLAVTNVDIGFIKVFRTLRALRPLRVITRNRGLKIVVLTLVESIKGITNVALISALNYLIFGILGVQFFSGKLYKCSDPEIEFRVNCTGLWKNDDDRMVEREWMPLEHNFDNLGNAALALFEVSSMEWWVGVMYNGIDAVSHDRVGIRDHNPIYGLYFVVFIIISSFFLLNMFVGVVISNFNTVKNHMDGLSLLTEEQKLWVETQRLMLNFRPSIKLRPRANEHCKYLAHMIQQDFFEGFIGACIILNVVVLGMDYYGASDTYQFVLQTLNDIFSLIFLFEACLKIFTYSRLYFTDGWNRFDFFLVVVSIIGFGLRVGTSGSTGNIGAVQVFRVFRILRVLRLVKSAKQVRILLESLWYSLPSLGNIGLFLGLLFFMYAVLGVQLFYAVNKGERIDKKQTNFHNFWHAILILFKSMTVTDWNMFMHDCMVKEPHCIGSGPDANCGNDFSPVYFISFLLIASFVLTNLLVAIILDNFNTTMQLEKSQIRMADLHRFVEIWADYDTEATMKMPTMKFPNLLARLRPPLGIPRSKSHLEILQQSKLYRLPEHGGFIHFVETLIPLARWSIGIELSLREIREHEQQWRMNFPSLQELPILRYRNSPITVDQFFSATFIQAAHRRRMAMKKADRMRKERQQDIERFYELQNRALVSASQRRSFRGSASGGQPSLGGSMALKENASFSSVAPVDGLTQRPSSSSFKRPISGGSSRDLLDSVKHSGSSAHLGATLNAPQTSITLSPQERPKSPHTPLINRTFSLNQTRPKSPLRVNRTPTPPSSKNESGSTTPTAAGAQHRNGGDAAAASNGKVQAETMNHNRDHRPSFEAANAAAERNSAGQLLDRGDTEAFVE